MKLDGTDRVSAVLRRMQPVLKKNTLPVMREAANRIASGATSRARQHPRNLWRPKGGGRSPSPSYRVTEPGPYWLRVETPGGVAGKAEDMSEFMRLAMTPRGAALVRGLDAVYGRGGGSGNGRILWAAADELSDSIVDGIEDAVVRAAGDVEREMGGA